MWLRVTGAALCLPLLPLCARAFVQAPAARSTVTPRVAPRATVQSPAAKETHSAAVPVVLALAGAAALAGPLGQAACKTELIANVTPGYQAIPWWDRMSRPTIEPGIGIWAEKLNMTTIFEEEEGNVRTVPATILCVKRGGNMVTDKKWPEKHGHYSVQVGYERYTPDEKEKNSKKALQIERLARNECPPLRKIKDFRIRPQDWEKYEVGQKVWPSDFLEEGDTVDVHGWAKGKGFAGRIKRWGGKRGPMTHGSKHHRREGSIGAARPKRVLPGKHRAGWQGVCKSIAHNLKVIKIMDRIDEDNMPESIIVVKGSVPGYTAHWESGGSYVWLHKSKNRHDGRFKRDPVWLWYYHKGEDVDPLVPIQDKAWTWKTMFGRDIRWITHEACSVEPWLQVFPDGLNRLGCHPRRTGFFLAEPSSFKKYMYEADEGPIKPPLVPKGPVVDQSGKPTGQTTLEKTNGEMPNDKDLERVPLGAKAPPGEFPPPKGPQRISHSDGPVDHKMDQESGQAEKDLEDDLSDMEDMDQGDLKTAEANMVEDDGGS
eukprot:s569_g17.t1